MGLAAACALITAVSPGVALAVGVATGLLVGRPTRASAGRAAGVVLRVAVVGLGFGLPLGTVLATGRDGLLVVVAGIAGALLLGLALGRALRVDGATSTLLSSGTAICGGSAIAAVAPTIGAGPGPVGVAMATVFVLNAVSLYLFPFVAEVVGLTQAQFGLWAAVAIHDTSSVVGAAATVGPEALERATVLKLVRALWIVPLVLGLALARRGRDGARDGDGGRPAVPWFIALFVLASATRAALPAATAALDLAALAGRRLLVVALFLVGLSVTPARLRDAGWPPVAQGVLLWLVVAGVWLVLVLRVPSLAG